MKAFISLHETFQNSLKLCFSEVSGASLLDCHHHSIRQAHFNISFFCEKLLLSSRFYGDSEVGRPGDREGGDRRPEHGDNTQAAAAGPRSKHTEEQDVSWLL